MNKRLNFLDLFAGCGGLSEGFIRVGFQPVAHVEMDEAACFSLKTRMCYHWLKNNKKIDIYTKYLNQEISRDELYKSVPEGIINSVINKEISKESMQEIFQKIDEQLADEPLSLIIGGPPCQAYSLVGRSRDKHKMKDDKRNYLYSYYAEFLERYKPTYFIFENVTGLLSAKDKNGNKYFDSMLKLFKDIGYTCEYKVFNASEYGVPQARKRVIIKGSRIKTKNIDFKLEKNMSDIAINDLFADLPKLKAGEESNEYHKNNNLLKLKKLKIKNNYKSIPLTFHTARPANTQDLTIYKKVVEKWNKEKARLNYNDLPESLQSHKNKNSFTDRFKVVIGESTSSHTVVAHVSKDGHYYIHPDINQNRSLTPREVARLQTFPDDYYFESVSEISGRTAAYKQIGNAVPVLFAEKIAEYVMANISK